MAGKGLNLFDECAAECVYLCPQGEEWTSSSWGSSREYIKMCKPSAIANLQRAPTKINKNGAITKLRILVEQMIIRHLKIFRIIFNEMPVLLFILCWWYFSYLQIHLNKFFNVYFYEKMFFEIFVADFIWINSPINFCYFFTFPFYENLCVVRCAI